MIELHNYQQKGTDNVAEATQYYSEILRQLNTGGGKTVEFSHIAKRYITAHPGKSVLILVHRQELQAQSRRTLWEAVGVSAQMISSGMKYIPPAAVYVGMVESTHTRTHLIENIGLVIIDECHEEIFTKVYNQYRTGTPVVDKDGILEYKMYGAGDPIILGFSATPIAANKKKPLNRLYKTIIPGPQVNELIALGRLYPMQGLCQNITRAPKDVVDRLSLTVKGGDFDTFNMGEKYRKPRYVNNTVKKYQEFSDGKKAIVFNVNVLHSQTVAAAFTAAGYDCKHVDGNTPKKERAEIFKWYKQTPGAILCNCDIARMGFDEPSIECVIVNLSTMSLVKWLQMAGRGARRFMFVDAFGILHGYKEYFDIIDMGGNAVTHLDWNWDRDWPEIFANPPKPSKGGGVSPVKICPNEECNAVIHSAARVCPICGHVFPEGEIALEADLHEFIILTKNIDIAAIMKKADASRYAEYFPLFQIGRALAESAAKTVKEMTDERSVYIWQEYEKKGKEWHELHNIKRSVEGKTKRVFAAVMKQKCKEILYTELKNLYPKWKTIKEEPPPTPESNAMNITNIAQKIENLRALHYEL